MALFDDVFLSFEMHCAKPDEHIYREVDLAIGADLERTIFVDDTLANRAAAADLCYSLSIVKMAIMCL